MSLVRDLFHRLFEIPYVAGQGKENFQPRLVYVHEGGERVRKNRRRLKNAHYIAGIFDDPDDLWFKWIHSY